ncbi:MAG: extracellular solute-binding protein [Candidatus Wallacebacter cryptica]|jgi:ABC-type glycerol-3-phosphate transport system substrate-binding protein|nr:extracellular solute-binding protein [Bacillota bacterium]
MKRTLTVSLLVMCLVLLGSGFVLAAYDFGGRTVRMVTHDMTRDGLWGDPLAQAHLENVEREFNVKLDIVAMHYDDGSIINDLQQGLLAGTADGIYWVKVGEAYQYANEGFFYPLTDLDIPESIFDQVVDPELLTFRGDRYFFIPFTGTVTQLATRQMAQQPDFEGLVWNKTKFEQWGLPNLYELVEAGEWTWDKFREIAIECTRDLDGDGAIDVWGYSPYATPWGFPEVHNWLITNGADVTTVDETGRTVFALDSPAALEALNFYQELHQLGVVYTGQPGYQAITNDLVMMAIIRPWTLFIINDFEDDLGYVPLPKGPRRDDYVYPAVSGGLYAMAIPATTKEDPEALVALAHAAMFDTPDYLDFYGLDFLYEDSWSMVVRDYESLEYLIQGVFNTEFIKYDSSVFLSTNFFNTWNEYNSRILNGESPASVVASFKDAAQAQLDEMLNFDL